MTSASQDIRTLLIGRTYTQIKRKYYSNLVHIGVRSGIPEGFVLRCGGQGSLLQDRLRHSCRYGWWYDRLHVAIKSRCWGRSRGQGIWGRVYVAMEFRVWCPRSRGSGRFTIVGGCRVMRALSAASISARVGGRLGAVFLCTKDLMPSVIPPP